MYFAISHVLKKYQIFAELIKHFLFRFLASLVYGYKTVCCLKGKICIFLHLNTLTLILRIGYWVRIDKPRIDKVRIDKDHRTDKA
jgi:hypothetical protein